LIERRGLEGLRDVVIEKAKEEAERILREAEEEARAEVEGARREKEKEARALGERILRDAETEAARILARARIRARNIVLEAKNEVAEEVIKEAKRILGGNPRERMESLARLIRESVSAIGGSGLRVMVSKGEVEIARELIEGDEDLSKRVEEVVGMECSGGVVVEELNGGLRIDNTYESRLGMLIPNILPMIGKELRGG
jgi:V/A-type H+-transporting ATPase subunit E